MRDNRSGKKNYRGLGLNWPSVAQLLLSPGSTFNGFDRVCWGAYKLATTGLISIVSGCGTMQNRIKKTSRNVFCRVTYLIQLSKLFENIYSRHTCEI